MDELLVRLHCYLGHQFLVWRWTLQAAVDPLPNDLYFTGWWFNLLEPRTRGLQTGLSPWLCSYVLRL